MYICIKCGYLVEDIPTEGWKHTELDGSYYEYDDLTCSCGGEFVEAVECECCGEYEAECHMNNGWCRSCVAELCEAHDLDPKAHRAEIYDIIESERDIA